MISLLHVKARIGARVLRSSKPLFNWRGRIIGRKFLGSPLWYDAAVRRGIERFIDVFEMWEHGPAFARMDEELAALDRFHEELKTILEGEKR